MGKRTPHLFQEALIALLTRIHDHSQKCLQQGQKSGVCTVFPKYSGIDPPSKEIMKQLETQAAKYFQKKDVVGYYFHYFTPPILPELEKGKTSETFSNYHLIYDIPQFDEEWQKARLARDLIYCPSNQEWGEDIDWFEIQMEAIRLTPLLHQSLEECKILTQMHTILGQPGLLRFEDFIYEYAINDPHFPFMNKSEKKKWNKKEVDWKIRYRLIANLFPPRANLIDIYVTSRKKAASSRNQMLKNLLWGFAEAIENELILNTSLPDEKKKEEISRLRAFKQRPIKSGKYFAKRPAICISDLECAAVLYYLCDQFLKKKRKSTVLGEGIIFIWIAQHSAFSGLHLTVEDFLTIKISDIDFESLLIQVNEQEIFLSQGLMDILNSWIISIKLNESDLLFQKLNYANLEDLLSKKTSKLFGVEYKLLPKDFLEKAHVMPGIRIPLELRREITKQEELIKNSPYRIKSQKIKEQLKKAHQQKIASTQSQ